MQAAFRFVLRPLKADDTLAYQCLTDPSCTPDWSLVFEVLHSGAASQQQAKRTCPICMEDFSECTAPRVTKCGHIFCYPCLLQYF
jgi:hypothetical protein